MRSKKEFREIHFGLSSAERESALYPQLLLKGFIDPFEAIKKILNGHEFLVLGYKGSGKSAISEHLRLVAAENSNLFVRTLFLKDFSYSDFRGITQGDAQYKYPTAWAWLLLLTLMASFQDDNGADVSAYDYYAASETLKALKLLPMPDLSEVVQRTSKRSFKAALPQILEGAYEVTSQEQVLQIPFFVEKLKLATSGFKSASKHIVVIDGLDDVLIGSALQLDALAALLLEAERLNLHLFNQQVPAKIVILCRTDLFERLPGPNKNKLRQDSAINLDWYHDTREPRESNLIKLVDIRSRLSDARIEDTFYEYFPDNVEGKVPEEYMLLHTRHTPRDILQILVHIQKVSRPGRLSRDAILSGLGMYSRDYFLPEIRDELVGYFSPNQISDVFALLGSLRTREFDYEFLCAEASKDKRFVDLPIQELLVQLFECSAIGNIQLWPSGAAHFTFKYRNRNSAPSMNERFILHNGLWKALNLI